MRKRETMNRKPLVQYTLHPHTGRYNGCLVALIHPDDGKIHIGWAQCRVNEHFKKSRGRDIAMGRAMVGTKDKPCPYRFYSPDGRLVWKNTFQDDLVAFKLRAFSYFTPQIDGDENNILAVSISLDVLPGDMRE